MRPLVLKLKGLRSYREEQTIDFSDVSLIAIIGDTGAGKSSLLEAITVALYGTCTWDNKAVKPLISDGVQQLSVELTFRAEGKTWRATRSMSKTNYPPPVHRLECLDDGSKLDGEKRVQERLRHVIGLDYDAFLRAVVLPQGRFAMLLQATDAERTRILKGILRLERLERVREAAIDALDRMQPIAHALRLRRATLFPDPAAAATEARAKRDAADMARKKLQTIHGAFVQARKQATESFERARTLEALAERARRADDTDAAKGLHEIEKHAWSLDAEIATLERAITARSQEEEGLTATLVEADRRGRGPVPLERARADIEMLRDEWPTVEAELADCAREDESILLDAKKEEEETAALGESEKAEADARSACNEREEEATAVSGVVERGRRLIAELEKAEQEERRSAKKLEKIAEAVKTRTAEAAEAMALEQKMRAKREEAAAIFQAAERREAAHMAAQGAKPGDLCPVCERALPAGFRAPRAHASLEAARKKRDEATELHADADRKRIKAEERVENQLYAHGEAEGDFHDRRTEVENVKKELLSALPGKGDAVKRLANAEARTEAVAEEARKARMQADRTHDAVTQARAALDGHRRLLKERRAAAKKKRDALTKRSERLVEAHARLPKNLRPKLPIVDSEATELLRQIEVWRAQFEQTERVLSTARTTRRGFEDQQKELSKRRDEVKAQVHAIEKKLSLTAERLTLLASVLSFDAPPAQPERGTVGEIAAWAEALAARASDLLIRCDLAVDEARTGAARAEAAAHLALAEAGVNSDAALDTALVEAQAMWKTAGDELARAEREGPIAAELDARIARASAHMEALTEVRGLLADGKLVQHIVSKKQRVLLGVASELLSSMTRNRYGFSETFDVVDRLSGQARGTRTLSGGETFLASLALALGLVELAGRSGGRLDALFLDEGFGSLDAGSLNDALEALERLADRGRLVAVISHVRAVAESIDRVLAVKLQAEGSRAVWVTAPERDTMLAEDVGRRLLS